MFMFMFRVFECHNQEI